MGRKYDDDSSVEISDVELSESSDAPSTIPDEAYEEYQLTPLDDDLVDRAYDSYDEVTVGDSDAEEEDETGLLLQKQEKFFERLNHFMDVQRKVEERMQKIDPSGRLAEIEVEAHSGGLVEDDGTYKLMYQQKDAEGEPVRTCRVDANGNGRCDDECRLTFQLNPAAP